VHALPPGVPDKDDDPTTELPPFTVAIDDVSLDPETAPGYDLDGLCTCDDRPGAKADGGPSCSSDAAPTCDLGGGADNTLAVVGKNNLPGEAIDKLPNRLIDQGQRSILFKLTNYNGLANDQDVSVGALVAEGIDAQGCPTSVQDSATLKWSPGRCGNDTWTVSQASVVPPLRALVSGRGYVRDFELVARFDKPVVLPFTPSAAIELHEGLLHATIVPLDESLAPRDKTKPPTEAQQRLYRLENGVLAGRAPRESILTAVGSYGPGGGPILCTTPAVFDSIRDTICTSADLAATSNEPLTSPCTMLSGTVGFVAIPALAGAIVPSPSPPPECTPSVLACP
jgi:hypothetical protein